MAVQYKDYYETLGVPKDASANDIRSAFRKLARLHHPDVSKDKDKKGAEAKFKEINEAYEVLSDPEKRKKYDVLGSDWENASRHNQGGWGGGPGKSGGDPFGGGQFGGTGFSDFFEQFFAGRTGGARPNGFPQAVPARGVDIEADLLVTIEEALLGAKKKVSFRREGNPKVETYEVRIPKGVRESQRIRLAGQGDPGAPAAQAGDLYLRVRFARHPDYQMDGVNLVAELELPVAKVVLGTEADVTTPDGVARIKIPPGTQTGRKFRLKGRGLPSGPNTRGDFFVQIEVQIPTGLTPEQREHWEALAALEV